MSIKTTVAPVAVVGGAPSDRPGGILVYEPSHRAARARRRGSLYALIEISGPAAGREVLATQLLETMREVYSRYEGSVTAGLQQAVRAVNDRLFQVNRNALPGDQRTAGITCAALRDADLFVVQSGPSALYLAHAGKVTRFPDDSPWLDDLPLDDVDAAPLGGRRDPSLALFHVQVADGDTLLLAESTQARRLHSGTLANVLARPSVQAIVGALTAASNGADLEALVVQIKDGGASVTTTADSEPVAAARSSRRPLVPESTQAGRLAGLPVREWLAKAGTALAALLVGIWAALADLFRRTLPGQISTPSAPREKTGRPAQAGGERRALSQHETGARGLEPFRKPLIAVAIAIPILVAAIVSITVLRRSAEQKAELETLWQDANTSWQQAGLASDKVAIRTSLGAALTYLDELVARNPEHAEAVELRKKVQARLDELDNVKRITGVARLTTYPAGARPSRVVAEGNHIFVLDRNSGKVYHHNLDRLQKSLEPGTEGTVLLSTGQQVGSVLVGDLVDMTWMPVGEGRQQASLVILESNGSLVQYDPATEQLTPLELATPDTWKNPKLVGSYFGRFYVLDPSAGKIWRYMPTANGYADTPVEWLSSQTDLTGVIDMAIGDDIYLLFADGKVQRFRTGEPVPFDVSGWDSPLSNPSVLFARPPDELKSLYFADRGNKRIVQCSPDGKFERQFRLGSADGAEPLAGVNGLYVNEISGQAFFTSGIELYLAELPESQ